MTIKPGPALWMVLLLAGSIAWSHPAYSATAGPPAVDNHEAKDEAEPFDPFDDATGDIYGEEGEFLQMVADPLAGFNRAMFVFNDKLYFWLLKPVSSGYRVVVPTPVRVSVKNFFYNIQGPVRFVNCLLQRKWIAAESEFCRFMVNSTAGFLGFFNIVHGRPEFNPPEEDFGQTLGTYSVGNGFYIVWPFFGPSTLRDTAGSAGDWALNPFSFMQLVNVDAGALTSSTTNVVLYGVRTVNDTSFRIGDYEALKDSALDPYEAFRSAYIQNRNSKIAR
jgi:phospholipid-binding lipoprotein MlaA